MSIQEIETELLKLPELDRVKLAEFLLASVSAPAPFADGDPILGLGSDAVDCGVSDGSTNHDKYLYGNGGL